MMDAFWDLIRRLTILIMLLTLVDLLLPEGNMRKYARLTGGMVLMFSLVSPVVAWLSGGGS